MHWRASALTLLLFVNALAEIRLFKTDFATAATNSHFEDSPTILGVPYKVYLADIDGNTTNTRMHRDVVVEVVDDNGLTLSRGKTTTTYVRSLGNATYKVAITNGISSSFMIVGKLLGSMRLIVDGKAMKIDVSRFNSPYSGDVFITEVFDSSAKNEEWVEVHLKQTQVSKNWRLERFSSGLETHAAWPLLLPSTGTPYLISLNTLSQFNLNFSHAITGDSDFLMDINSNLSISSGAYIVLYDENSRVIDAVKLSKASGGDDFQSQERVHLDIPAIHSKNWILSTDILRSTPGRAFSNPARQKHKRYISLFQNKKTFSYGDGENGVIFKAVTDFPGDSRFEVYTISGKLLQTYDSKDSSFANTSIKPFSYTQRIDPSVFNLTLGTYLVRFVHKSTITGDEQEALASFSVVP